MNKYPSAVEKLVNIRTYVGIAVAVLALAACSKENHPTNSSTSIQDDTVEVTLDYSRLMPDGNCQGGAPRPCFAPLRAQPHFDSLPLNILVGSDGQQLVEWPYEDRDSLNAVCVTKGDVVSTGDGAEVDSTWVGVVVPLGSSHLSAEAVASIRDDSLDAHTTTNDEAVLFTPRLWIEGQLSLLKSC